jgi:AcrR family transcriptional regulator
MGSRVNEISAYKGIPAAANSLVGYGSDDSPSGALPAPPTQARGVDKRDRIFEAAMGRYATQGVSATTVEEIIADAGVSWATFFRYFPRKQDVLVEHAARHFRTRVTAVVAEGLADRRLRVRTILERTFAALLEPGDEPAELHIAAILEVFAHPPRFAALVGEGHPQPVVGLVSGLLTEARDRGELRAGIDPGLAALTVVAGALFPAAQAAAIGADPEPPMRAALDVVWRGVGAGD